MDKLKELLSQMGASEELVSQFCEEFENYKSTLEENLNDSYKEKCDRARKLCLEEVEAEKARLARKVEIFLESKVDSIETSAKKRIAIEEAEAANTLKAVKQVVEGVEIGSQNGGNQATLVKMENQVKALKAKMRALSEDRDRAKRQATEATKMARRALSNNRILEGKLKAKGATVAESRKSASGVIAESRKPKSKVNRDSTQTTVSSRVNKVDPDIARIAKEME